MARNGFRGASDAPRKGAGTLAVPEEFGGAITLSAGEHRQAERSVGWDQPRPRRTTTPAAAHPCRARPRTPGSMLPQASAKPPVQRREPREHAGDGEGDSWQGRRLRTCPARGSEATSGPNGKRRPRPCRSRPAPPGPAPPGPYGLPDAPSDPSRPNPDPLAPEAQRRSGSREHSTFP